MKKFIEFIKNPHIIMSTVSGICIIALAYFSKRVLQVDLSVLENSTPGWFFMMWEVAQKKTKNKFWAGVIPWASLMVLSTVAVLIMKAI